MKTQDKRLLTTAAVLYALNTENCVLHAPSFGAAICELTVVGDDFVFYTVAAEHFKSIMGAYLHNEQANLAFIFMYEPGCVGDWCLVSKDNKEAMKYSVNLRPLVAA